MKTLFFLFLTCSCLQATAQRNTVPPDVKKQEISGRLFKTAVTDSTFRAMKPLSLNTVYYNHLGFMCRQELKLEKATKTSFRVRLGTVEYTDRREGKIKPWISE